MHCGKCGNILNYGDEFCNKCGTPINKQQEKNEGLDNKQKIIIISLLSVFLVLLIICLLLNPKGNKGGLLKKDTRTIMMYMVGNDLESKNGIATSDIEAIDPSLIDLEKTNVIMYTGGTKHWMNDYISSEENAIYKLTSNGFEKVKVTDKLDMGDSDTLSAFINYTYKNYPASNYTLLFYDHGGAIQGAVYDEFTENNLSLEDFADALKSSPFNENNKLNSVIFRTCLNGTLEVASLFAPYANYLTFSEEVSWGGSFTNVLSFINNVTPSQSGAEVGKEFLNSYSRQMKEIDSFGSAPRTYSVVDLSKINKVIDELNKYINKIDVKANYNDISKLRSNIYQYGMDVKAYDTVDLKSLIKGLEDITNIKADNLLKAIDDALVYNDTNLEGSNGISIYFPCKGKNEEQGYFLRIYNKLGKLSNYNTFIKGYYSIQSGSPSFSFDIRKNETYTVPSTKEVSIKLTEEEIKNYSYATYVVFEKDQEHPNYYKLLYSSNNAVLSDDGTLTTNIGDNLITATTDDNNKIYLPIIYRKYGNDESLRISAFMYSNKKDITEKNYYINSDLYLTYNNNKPEIAFAKIKNANDERIIGALLDLKEYDRAEILLNEWRILDNDGNLLSNTEWEAPPTMYLFSTDFADTTLEKATLKDGEYYVVFFINDVNNESHMSKLIKVGE